MAKTKNYNIPELSQEECQQLIKNIEAISSSFKGDLTDLESALGMFVLGRLYGWRVLVLIHNKRTIRKYEQILGINIRECFPEEGALSERSVGLNAIKGLGNFWKYVSGDLKIEGRKELAN